MAGARVLELLAGVDRRWRPLRDLADRVGFERLEATTPAGWTGKEMLAHIAFWDEAVEGAVRGIFRGESTEGWRFGSGYVLEGSWPRDDVHNAREAAWARTQPTADVLARCDRAHEAMVAFLHTVADAEIAAHESYFTSLGEHYTEHHPELEALFRNV